MVVLGSSALAQTQKFTMAEAVNGLRTNLAVKNISQFSWSADGKSYIQAVKGGYLITNLKTNKQDTLVSLTQLNKNLAENKFKAVPPMKFTEPTRDILTRTVKWYGWKNQEPTGKARNTVAVDENAENMKVFGDNRTFGIYRKE